MTSPVDKITDYQQRLRDDMLSQLYADPVHEAIADAIALEDQRFEDVAYDVLTKRLLDNATGDILDVIGRIARVDRLGRTDDEYRSVIQVWIAAHDSDGGIDQILWIVQTLLSEVCEYRIYPPAAYRLTYVTATPISAQQVEDAAAVIDLATSAGVGYQLSEGDDPDAFRFNSGPGFNQGKLGNRIV